VTPEEARRAFTVWAESREHRRLVAETLAEIRRILEEHPGAYVSYSGGKDSIVLLHLAARVKPGLRVFHWDHGPYLMPREVEAEILSIAKIIAPRAGLRVYTAPGLWREEARWDYQYWYRAFHAKLEELARQGWEPALIGLRAEESTRRRLRTRDPCKRGNHGLECYPLRKWSHRDIWAYIFTHNLPYPRVYNQYCPLLGWDRCRLVTFHDEEFRHLGTNLDGIIMWYNKNIEYKTRGKRTSRGTRV